MRPLRVVLAALLVAATLAAAAQPAAAESAVLSTELDRLVAAFAGGAAIFVADEAGTPLYERDADREIVAASLYKLGLLALVEREVDRGALRYSDLIVIEPEDITSDGALEAPGDALTVDEALERMITLSDNGTAVHFLRRYGGGAANAFLTANGVSGLRLAMGDEEDMVATAKGVGRYFALLARKQLVSSAASERMLARLLRQKINDRLPAQLPEGTRVAHKTGDLSGVVHDAGIVFTPAGARVVAVLTYDGDNASARELVAEVGAAVYGLSAERSVAASYRVPKGVRYVATGAPLVVPVTVRNIGEAGWPLDGDGRVGLSWELRDASGPIDASASPLPLGQVPAGGNAGALIVLSAPERAAELKLVLRLAGADGRPLSRKGVAVPSVRVRVHEPFTVAATARSPGLLYAGEVAMLEIAYVVKDGSRPRAKWWR